MIERAHSLRQTYVTTGRFGTSPAGLDAYRPSQTRPSERNRFTPTSRCGEPGPPQRCIRRNSLTESRLYGVWRGEGKRGRGKALSLNSASLTPKPLASNVYVHVLEAPCPLKRSVSVMSLLPCPAGDWETRARRGRAGQENPARTSLRGTWFKPRMASPSFLLSSGRIFNLFCHNAMRAEKCYPNSWCFSRSRPRIPINRCCLDDSRVRTVCCGWCLVFPFLGYRLTTSRMPSNSESSRRREISSPARRTRRHITDRRSWAILQYNP